MKKFFYVLLVLSVVLALSSCEPEADIKLWEGPAPQVALEVFKSDGTTAAYCNDGKYSMEQLASGFECVIRITLPAGTTFTQGFQADTDISFTELYQGSDKEFVNPELKVKNTIQAGASSIDLVFKEDSHDYGLVDCALTIIFGTGKLSSPVQDIVVNLTAYIPS